MTATGRCRKMQHLSTAFLIVALVIAVNTSRASAQDDIKDQIADESKNDALILIEGPKYVAPPNVTAENETQHSEPRPPLTSPRPAPDKRPPRGHPEPPRGHPEPPRGHPEPPRGHPEPPHGHPEPPRRPQHGPAVHKGPPPRHLYSKPMKLRQVHTSMYRVVPLSSHKKQYYSKPQSLVYAASNGKPVRVPHNQPPKFSVPIETINGIRTDVVRPPKSAVINSTTTTTTTTTTTPTTTTKRPLRNKRIWPKRLLEKQIGLNKTTTDNSTSSENSTSTNSTDLEIASATYYRFRYVDTNRTKAHATTTFVPLTITRGYRRVVRVPKHKHTTTTTAAYDPLNDTNYTSIEPNDWVPIVPSHYPKKRRRAQTPISRRSDAFFTSPEESPDESKRMMYLQSYGLVPVASPHAQTPVSGRKRMVVVRKKKRPHNPYVYSGYSTQPVVRSPTQYLVDDLRPDASHLPHVVTRIKHHHHHHHHRYIKTVEKPIKVPYKVEVPRPFPVPVEKKVPIPIEKIKIVEKPVPYPVPVEKRVPYPVQVKVPHPVPYKVVEKEYVPKPYPVVQHVPVLKHVEVKVPQPYPVEKRVPYPVEVQVPVDRPYPVTVEKRVPYPVPVKVLVPQPYPVETKVPYPVEVKVKEPVEVVKHVPVKVPVPQPYPVRVPTPVAVPVEKRVPYPIEVERKVPVPVIVNQKVEVERKVPVYVPRPYTVEKKVPVPVKVPYPVQVPYYNEVYINQPYSYQSSENYGRVVNGGVTVSDEVTSSPHHTVTVHGNTGFAGFQSRSDKTETTSSSAETSESSESTTVTSTTTESSTNATQS